MKAKGAKPELPDAADEERKLARCIAYGVRAGIETRAEREFAGSLLRDSPRLFRLIADELESIRHLEPWEKRKPRRGTLTGDRILKVALRALGRSERRNDGYGIAQRGAPFRFVKGDARINRKGRPRTFDALRERVQKLLAETVETRDGEKCDALDVMLRNMLTSREPALQRALLEYGFGKVPDKIEATGLEGKTTLVLHFAHERKAVEAETIESDTQRLTLPDSERQNDVA